MLTIGDNARIHRSVNFSHRPDTLILVGDRANFFRGSEILGPVTIGNNVFINRDAYIRPHTTIGDNVSIGPFVRLITDTHDIGPATKRAGKARNDPISIGAGTWIGASVTVVGGVTIGAGSVIAAGAIVTSDVPDNVLVGGVPARILRVLTADGKTAPHEVPEAETSPPAGAVGGFRRMKAWMRGQPSPR